MTHKEGKAKVEKTKGTEKQREGKAKGRKTNGKERTMIRKDGTAQGMESKEEEKQRE